MLVLIEHFPESAPLDENAQSSQLRLWGSIPSS